MSDETTKQARARKAMENSRRTVAGSTLLTPEFKATADSTIAQILARMDDGSLTVDEALTLMKSLMDAVLIQSQHTAFQAKGPVAMRFDAA